MGLCVLLAACEAQEPQPAPPREVTSAAHCEERSFEGSPFTACRYDARRHRLELILDGDGGSPLRSLERLEEHLGARAGGLLFAMNAGMFDDEGQPIGLYVEAGERRHRLNRREGEGNFHMMPNGVFAVAADGRVSIVRSEEFEGEPRWATQSGPLLVIDGRLHPAFQADGESRYVRNGVGVANPRTAWFVISEEPVSFGRFARFFRDVLGCRNALYLDGGVSSLWDKGAGRRDVYSSLGPMVAIFRREPEPGRRK